ncbi:HxlR-like helix-turn-helix [Halolamina pelagica]|uniref:HxlR-like helix-turn-helix n=1 Tax=Halolamina pelagica TaxID=699431 RepID=A0A0P7GDH3_9EURY|nr:helix-turn-helix domain-containing protein [Halolamina pelagica]KPN32192.1 HxlR-like helix-turn-helix [Halolamina pelagica]
MTSQPDDPEKLPVWCAGEEWCPVTTTAMLVGKKWHPVVIDRLLAQGACGFSELEARVDGISSKVLSDVLDDLESKQLIDREIVNEKPVRTEYSLTDHGASLESVIDAMHEWGEEHLVEVDDPSTSLA